MSLLATDDTRKINSVLPYQKSHSFKDFYQGGRYDIRKIIDFFKNEGRLIKEAVL
jgi:hypothetical protein